MKPYRQSYRQSASQRHGRQPHRQAGQADTKIGPELCLACGISRAIQHGGRPGT